MVLIHQWIIGDKMGIRFEVARKSFLVIFRHKSCYMLATERVCDCVLYPLFFTWPFIPGRICCGQSWEGRKRETHSHTLSTFSSTHTDKKPAIWRPEVGLGLGSGLSKVTTIQLTLC